MKSVTPTLSQTPSTRQGLALSQINSVQLSPYQFVEQLKKKESGKLNYEKNAINLHKRWYMYIRLVTIIVGQSFFEKQHNTQQHWTFLAVNKTLKPYNFKTSIILEQTNKYS